MPSGKIVATFRIDPALLARLDRLAVARRSTRTALLVGLIERKLREAERSAAHRVGGAGSAVGQDGR